MYHDLLSNKFLKLKLNYLKDYKRYIHILSRILDLAWPKQMKLTLEQQYMLSFLHSQYHADSLVKCHWMGYTETTLDGVHRNYIEIPQLPLQCTPTAPPTVHLQRTSHFVLENKCIILCGHFVQVSMFWHIET